jgi:hypothetical protein
VKIQGGTKALASFPIVCSPWNTRCQTGQSSGHFFLEADRGTMPVTRWTLSQTSFFRKLLAYEATWTQKSTSDISASIASGC